MEEKIQENQPDLVQTPAAVPEKKSNTLLIVILVIAILLIPVGVYAGMQLDKKQVGGGLSKKVTPTSIPQPTQIPTSIPAPDETANWKTYSGDGFIFKYPDYLEELLSGKQFSSSVRSKQEIINEYQAYKNKGGCPSNCGSLVDDPALLQKQFDLLTSISNLKDCNLTAEYKSDFSKNFILFSGGISKKNEDDIEGVKIGNICGVRYLENDGFDVDLNNYYYKIALTYGDKIIGIGFHLFPYSTFNEVDELYKNLGYVNNGCDATCGPKMVAYIQSLDLKTNKVVKNVSVVYDQILSTFKFTE